MTRTLFGASIQNLTSALTAREKSQGVYAANVANADTPNYRADKRTFADFYTEHKSSSPIANIRKTDSHHLSPKSSNSLLGDVFQRGGTAARMDGNTVDTQHEMTSMAENQMMHELNMRILKGRLDGMANVIKDGGR